MIALQGLFTVGQDTVLSLSLAPLPQAAPGAKKIRPASSPSPRSSLPLPPPAIAAAVAAALAPKVVRCCSCSNGGDRLVGALAVGEGEAESADSGEAAGGDAWCAAACSTSAEVQGVLPGCAHGGRAIGPESGPMGFCGPEALDACRPVRWCWRVERRGG
ncbi:hypothetical protein QYE76_055181 [Lolium multiflorum]|uniref:Uncharacterized protein n=1 Tax=Lolium multiflorum TaxID=4521 RepID=A0AAD8SZX7_LOLMU|nr:hypothetical protein QYE76_055181 [Lolium multiflorum]